MAVFDINLKLAFSSEQERTGLCSEISGSELIKYVNIELETLDSVVRWNGITSRDFEIAHGITRFVKSVPEKLATALAVNRESLPEPTDDGSYLLDLIVRLLDQYSESYNNGSPTRSAEASDENHFFRSVRIVQTRSPWLKKLNDKKCEETLTEKLQASALGSANLDAPRERVNGVGGSLERLRNLLFRAKDSLMYRDEQGYRMACHRILSACQEMQYLSETYCKLAHLILTDSSQRNTYSEGISNLRASTLKEYLSNLPDLQAEFLNALTRTT